MRRRGLGPQVEVVESNTCCWTFFRALQCIRKFLYTLSITLFIINEIKKSIIIFSI